MAVIAAMAQLKPMMEPMEKSRLPIAMMKQMPLAPIMM